MSNIKMALESQFLFNDNNLHLFSLCIKDYLVFRNTYLNSNTFVVLPSYFLVDHYENTPVDHRKGELWVCSVSPAGLSTSLYLLDLFFDL